MSFERRALVVYRVENTTVFVLRVFYGGRDYERELTRDYERELTRE